MIVAMLSALLFFISAGALSAQTPPNILPSYKDLKFPPLPPLKLPEPTIVTLSNGIKVFMLEEHELPLVRGTALIRTGNLFDPADKRGLADLTGTVLRSGGTKDKTGNQIDVQLENIAASVESGIGESSATMSFSCLKENTDEVLGVFHDLMTAPEFRQDKVDLAKTQFRSSISRRNDDPGGIGSREFASLVYGRDTPYGWDINYEHVDRIQRKDMVDFYRRYYFPANIMLGIHGDFSIEDMKARLEKLFGGWNYTQPPVPGFPAVGSRPSPGVFVAEQGDVTQTFFEIGHLGGVLSDKDYPALEVAADILGGGFSSRLFKRVRTRLGYAYNIASSWGANYDHPGLFDISGSTQSRYTVATIKATLEEVDRLRSGEVTDAELKTAKDSVLNGFVFFFDRPSKTLNRMLVYAYYGYPRDFIFRYQESVGAVTKADVLRVARKYFRPQDLTIVAVGNPKDFGTPITDLGLKVQPIDLTIPEPASPETKPSPQGAVRMFPNKHLFDRVRQSPGGTEQLAAVKDVDYTADMDLQGAAGAMKGSQRGWVAARQSTQAMPVLQQVQGETFRLLYRLVMSDAGEAGNNTLEFKDQQAGSVKMEVDDTTGLPLRQSYAASGMSGPVQVEETFSARRDVNGIKLPFERSVLQNGKKVVDVHIQDYKFNTGVTPEQLSKQP
jgi:zinc protease